MSDNNPWDAFVRERGAELTKQQPDGRLRIRLPIIVAEVEIDDGLPLMERASDVLYAVDHLHERAIVHTVTHYKPPFDRLALVEAAARELLDALGVDRRAFSTSHIPSAAYKLSELLKAKPGAVTWRRTPVDKEGG